MSPLETLLREADSEAASLGHTIVWEAIGDRTARGRCSGCGRHVEIALERNGRPAHADPGFHDDCTRDLILRKPSLQDRTEPENVRPDRAVTT